ncbi:MAG: AsmA-like C-terminal region-containing protein [Bacteroidales bacterium]|nr:AsmA-like C-terminal region-containing protein [Bacteroidales bacterium]
MKQRLRIILEYLSAFVLIIMLLLTIASVVVVKFYGDDLKAYVMEQINHRLDSKVDVEEITVKVFQKFPNTSIHLKNVTIWSSHNFNTRNFNGPGADTLLCAKDVNVSFNLLGLIRKKYNIRQLEIKKGILHLYTDLEGEVNYKIFSGGSGEQKEASPVNLSNLRIIDFSMVLNNQAKQLVSTGTLKRIDLNGRFSKRNTHFRGSLTGWLGKISNKEILYASNREIEAELNLDVRDSLYTIKSGHLQLDRIVADMDGQFIVHQGEGVEMDLFATARDLEIHEVLDLLPSEISNPLKGIKGSGILQLYSRITGMVSSTLTPKIEADFQTSHANLSWDRLPFSVKNLNLNGTYSNGGKFNPVTTSLIIESLNAVIGTDHLSLNGRIHNFYDPVFSFKLKGDIHPEQWLGWYNQIPLYKSEGTIFSDVTVSGSYDRLKPKGQRFLTFDFAGGLSIEDVMVRIHKEDIPFTNLNGTIHIENDFWEPSLSGSFGKSDFNFSGSGLNLLSYLLKKDDPLVASATLRTNRFDLQEIIDNFSGTDKEGNRSIFFPDRLNLKLDFVIDEFLMQRFDASNVRGVATYDSPILLVDSLTMQTMDGTLTGDYGIAQDRAGDIFVNVNSTLYNLDIKKLFYSLNNFRQNQLTDEHLKGAISGNCMFSSSFDSTFSIRKESILSENSVTIRDGELNSFSPILALSRFIEVEELRNIQFETLENNILIKEGQVIIPSMDIHTNALNMSVSGIHGFNNHYDYRLRLKLSELLYSKARGARNSEFNIADDDSDTRVLFLKVINDGTGAQVEMDREKTAEKIRNDLNQEKMELKMILNKELGLFKHDKTVVEAEDPQKERDESFTFEFSEEPDSARVDKKREKVHWRKKRVKKETNQNKPAVEFVIDEQP